MQVIVTVAPPSRAGGVAGSGGTAEHALGDPHGSRHSPFGRSEAAVWSPSLWDAHALEAAVELGESHEDVTIHAVTVGPPAADSVVRAALAKGADRAVRVWDDHLDGADLLEPRLTARLLAAVTADVDPAVVLSGAQSGPDGFGATGVALAARLGYGWAAVVTELSLDRDAGVVSVRRDLDGNRSERVAVDLPAVLTVGTGCNEPRTASLGAVRAAQRADVAVRSLADLGIEQSEIEPSLTRVGTVDRERDVTLLSGAPEDAAADLAAVLRRHGVDP